MRFDSKRAADVAADAKRAHAAFAEHPHEARNIEELFRLINRMAEILAQSESDQGSSHRT